MARKTQNKTDENTKIDFPNCYRVVAADLSLRRPGLCVLNVRKTDQGTKVKVKKLISVDNKTGKKKCHGQLLEEIRDAFMRELFPIEPDTYFVRETGIMHQGTPAERNLSKVEGLMDWIVWKMSGKEWYSIYPVTVKKLITGSGKAEKEDVAAALGKYVGEQNYKCDDESDSVAVGLAWLIQQRELEEIP